MSNSATREGGGMFSGTANNCTITGNSAINYGGGMSRSTANNCIVWYNTAPRGTDLFAFTAHNTCSPDLAHGVDGNITNSPSFISNYHLQTNSLCINWGGNVYVSSSIDLDSNPRIVENHVDMGCYEYQGSIGLDGDLDGNGYLDVWEREYFDGHVNPNANTDGDSQSDGDEYVTGTNPLDLTDFFQIHSATQSENHFTVYFNSFTNRQYQLFSNTNLTEDIWNPVSGAGIRLGTGGMDSMTDTNSVFAEKFYQLKVSLP
jgi:hypothetical protein